MNYESIQDASIPEPILSYIAQLENEIEEIKSENIKYKNEIAEIKSENIEIKNENIEIRNENLILNERVALLLFRKFCRSAERASGEKQPDLFDEGGTAEAEKEPEEAGEELVEIKAHKRKKRGRRAIDPSLPRVDTVIDIPEEERKCACGAELAIIGYETSEKLHIVPQKIWVERIKRAKRACRQCEGTEDEDRPAVRIAPAPPSVIPRSIASADLLSYIVIQKFEDHLPYYRQEKMFARIGVEISRQDMANWQQQAHKNIAPLFKMLKEKIKQGDVMQMDETTVQVMGEEGRSDTQKSYMWLARGGPREHPIVLYEYRPTRGAMNIKDFIDGFSGFLQTDGYEGYDAALKGRGDIIHVGCFAHARRKFFEASKAAKNPQSAMEGINYIKKLYALESELREKVSSKKISEEEFLSERRERAGPILEKFKAWLLKRAADTPPSLLLGKAVHYALGQWDKLAAYLESPRLTPDNNGCENAIRPFVLGRKNWLFNKSPEGAVSGCGMYSLIETARQNGLVPLTYLTKLFEKAPRAKSPEDWEKLLPWNIFTA